MKINLSRKIIDPTNGEEMQQTLGQSIAAGILHSNSADPDFAKRASMLVQKYNQEGELDVPIKELGQIIDAVSGSGLKTWVKGHVLYLLGDEMPDDETKEFFDNLYVAKPD